MKRKDSYTPVEIAKLLNLHPESVRRFIRTGKLNAHRPGLRRYVISDIELKRFLGDTAYNELIQKGEIQ